MSKQDIIDYKENRISTGGISTVFIHKDTKAIIKKTPVCDINRAKLNRICSPQPESSDYNILSELGVPIPKLVTGFIEADTAYVVEGLLERKTLTSYIKDKIMNLDYRFLSNHSTAKQLIQKIGTILTVAETLENHTPFFFQDLKPDNLFFTSKNKNSKDIKSEQLYIVDMGCLLHSEQDSIEGSPEYTHPSLFDPEQELDIDQIQVGYKYSLGVIAMEVLLGDSREIEIDKTLIQSFENNTEENPTLAYKCSLDRLEKVKQTWDSTISAQPFDQKHPLYSYKDEIELIEKLLRPAFEILSDENSLVNENSSVNNESYTEDDCFSSSSNSDDASYENEYEEQSDD